MNFITMAAGNIFAPCFLILQLQSLSRVLTSQEYVFHTLEIPSTSILSGADLTKSLGEMSLASTGTFLPPTVSTSRKRQRSAETGETGETGEEGRLGFKQRRISTTQVLFKICV